MFSDIKLLIGVPISWNWTQTLMSAIDYTLPQHSNSVKGLASEMLPGYEKVVPSIKVTQAHANNADINVAWGCVDQTYFFPQVCKKGARYSTERYVKHTFNTKTSSHIQYNCPLTCKCCHVVIHDVILNLVFRFLQGLVRNRSLICPGAARGARRVTSKHCACIGWLCAPGKVT